MSSLIIGDHWFNSAPLWSFMGVFVVNGAAIILLLLNRGEHKKTQNAINKVEDHVNNVEIDIDHNDQDISLGQRLKRMEEREIKEFDENKRIHNLIIENLVDQAIQIFRQVYRFDHHVAAYHLGTDNHRSDQPWEVLWVNRAFEKLTGVNFEGIKTGQYIQAIHPDDRERVMSSAADAMTRGEVWHIVYRTRTRLENNTYTDYFTVEQYSEPLYNPIGEFSGQLGTVRIINEGDVWM